MQEKENSPSQPYQNSMSIHEMEAQEGESSIVKEIEEVITLRSGKELDLPTCKLEHKRIVIKEERMKHMPPPFLQALGIAKKLKKKIGAKSESNGAKTGEKQGKNRGLRDFAASAKLKFCCETSSQPNCPLCENFRSCETNFGTRVPLRSTRAPFRSCKNGCEPPKHEILHFAGKAPFCKGFGSCENPFCTRVPLRSKEHPFRSCETHCEVVKPDFAPKVSFCRVFRNCEAGFGTRVPFRSTVTLISQLRNGCEVPKSEIPNFTAAPPFRQLLDTSRSLPEVQIMHAISRWKAWEVTSP
ncbi:hypothetical protein CK203_106468 [Vitis vinifera]|uniref:Uncharacterized protein n=1 Tax=Vitis vinifera TaxID=29760 RepID=A0A438CHU7_VITVI|nr:hypothetical protein CK203_106468 [Vitis vinifera]